MGDYLDFTGPAALRTRGTVLVAGGRGESVVSYTRLGNRLAADSYRVRVLPPPDVDSADVEGSLDRYDETLAGAVTGIDNLQRPLVLTGADTGAAVVAALVAQGDGTRAWWPDAVVLAGLPGYASPDLGSWDEELDARTHCPVQRGVLSEDPSVRPGALTGAVAHRLLDIAYGTRSRVPHLLLVGADDALSDRQRLGGVAASLPAARLVVVRGAHHDVLNDLQHRSVAAEIVSFLETLRSERALEPIVAVAHSTW